MTPIVLLILVGMWAAVLLPPYLRDRNDTRAAGSGSLTNKLNALGRSFGGRERAGYLPVASSSLGTPQDPGAPLPAGSRHPITGRGAPRLVPGPAEPQSSAFQIVGRADDVVDPYDATRYDAQYDEDAAYLLAPDVDDELAGLVTEERRREIPAHVLSARAARKRRREVLYTLLAASGLSFLMAMGLGGPVLLLHLMIDAALVAYVALLIRHQKLKAEREIKVAFLPHGGEGASATELLAQGGGFRPGDADLAPVDFESTAFTVVRSQAN